MVFDMRTIITSLLLLLSANVVSMVELKDDQLADVTGQALLQMDKEFANGFTFYKAGLDAVLELNANMEKLQLGCGGVNQANRAGCDLDIDRFSLGCIANSAGNCVTLDPVGNQLPGAVQDTLANRQEMIDFVMTRPFFQFAVERDDSSTLRKVVGVRLGGESVEGPLSFGSLNMFSGFMSAQANIEMQGEQGIAITDPNDFDQDYNLGLNDFCAARALFCLADASEFIVEYDTANESYGVTASGNRQDKAYIRNTDLPGVVDDLVGTVDVTNDTSWLPGWAINAALVLFETQIGNAFKDQLAAGLGLSNRGELDGYDIPYNLSNVHQINISSEDFGLSFQSKEVRYPGYQVGMPVGWSMYAPDAFTLDISQPASVFVQNIVSGQAAAGNIVGLEAPYRNCWGSARFC